MSINVQPIQHRETLTPNQGKSPLLFDYSPSFDGVNHNLLILLHGLGDSKIPFTKLGKKLDLPQTAIMSVQAPEPVPYFDNSYQWFASFDPMTGEMLAESHPDKKKGLLRTRTKLTQLLRHVIDDCHFLPGNVFFFGFSQGGTIALDLCLLGDIPNLGGVVSISGYLLGDGRWENKSGPGYNGHILITQGSKDAVIGAKHNAENMYKVIRRLCSPNADTQQIFIANKDHSMPTAQEEWRAIHAFFAKSLSRREIALENMSDVYLVGNPSSS